MLKVARTPGFTNHDNAFRCVWH